MTLAQAIPINDQPISATFFNEPRWLTHFITPDALEVQLLYKGLTQEIPDTKDKLIACWNWVTSQVKYVKSVQGTTKIAGRTSSQGDLWIDPTTSIRVKRGNCATKSFLLASLLRNELPADQVYCVLGNLYNGKPGGHAWINVSMDEDCIMETTTPLAPPLVRAQVATRYEAVHYFNDEQVLAIEGKTQLTPYADVYSKWLSEYLHWAYIRNQ